jgi:hypothetical protein
MFLMTCTVIKKRLEIARGKVMDVPELYASLGAKNSIDQKRVRGVLCQLKNNGLIEHIGRALYYFPEDYQAAKSCAKGESKK